MGVTKAKKVEESRKSAAPGDPFPGIVVGFTADVMRDWDSDLPPVKPDGRLKDTEKIAADIENKQIKRCEESRFCPYLGRIERATLVCPATEQGLTSSDPEELWGFLTQEASKLASAHEVAITAWMDSDRLKGMVDDETTILRIGSEDTHNARFLVGFDARAFLQILVAQLAMAGKAVPWQLATDTLLPLDPHHYLVHTAQQREMVTISRLLRLLPKSRLSFPVDATYLTHCDPNRDAALAYTLLAGYIFPETIKPVL